MKVTKNYLRKIIRESLEEIKDYSRLRTDREQSKIRRFAQTVPSGAKGEKVIPQEFDDLPRGVFKIKKLNVNTGVLRSKAGVQRTELMPKLFYVYFKGPLEDAAFGPFDTEEEARQWIKNNNVPK